MTRGATLGLSTLVDLFYRAPDELGQFEEQQADQLPEPYRGLLAHGNHMTVTVEAFHRSPVDVRVLATQVNGTQYARKILLTRRSDGRVVQFGIMRVNFAYLPDAARREIESQQTPLGRVLIEHNVLREIHLVALWKVTPGDDLRSLFGLAAPHIAYGRTAIIDCNGQPAVELLEIVTPEPPA